MLRPYGNDHPSSIDVMAPLIAPSIASRAHAEAIGVRGRLPVPHTLDRASVG